MGAAGSGSQHIPRPAPLPTAPIDLDRQTAANGSSNRPNLRTQQVLGTVLNMEPTVVHDDLISWNDALQAPEYTMWTDVNQQQASSKDSKMMLLVKQVSEEALQQEPYLEELSDALPEE
ncbi:hypothetical protein UY3_02782 [Chelonia mydas]|uniref:Uncharacterized protein n=1 Tax=Chelonia mydas TaxID=8469 RepID=M7BRZ5_CHEMY|nr:hypothetical protein UY3_02782 [Chelonia mydas]